MDQRTTNWDYVRNTTFDVAIIGGGINGASIYHALCTAGYSVLLIDKADFAAGTSQSSAMMIWGGLLYLRTFDIRSVFAFSRARDALVKNMRSLVAPQTFRYIPAPGQTSKTKIWLGLYFYWLLSLLKRKPPVSEDSFEELAFIRDTKLGSLTYEDAVLRVSDARFVLQWITAHTGPRQVSLNYCALSHAEFRDQVWHLNLSDAIGKEKAQSKARWIINCGGVWTDQINAHYSIESPYKHVLSKGVFINFARNPNHTVPLIFEVGEHNDSITYLPWGAVSLFGPTETATDSISKGFTITPDDVRFLLKHANKNLKGQYDTSDIISMRCGIRPLAVEKSYNSEHHTLQLSRNSKVVTDPARHWISTYGGKLTGCVTLAKKVLQKILKMIPPSIDSTTTASPGSPEYTSFPGMPEQVPTMQWCMQQEYCCTLEDYVRRRTNIAQWIPREGLGRNNEHLPAFMKLALELAHHDEQRAAEFVRAYQQSVVSRFDDVLKAV